MKRSGPLKRSAPLASSAPLSRKTPLKSTGTIKSKPVKRDWTAARSKVEVEGRCRVCSSGSGLEAAHLAPRKHDKREGDVLVVDPDNIVPLCKVCHMAFDAGELELLPYLSHAEQAACVRALGMVSAGKRLGWGP